ncbi:MAG: hypothetical protein OXM60_25365 [Defluviicoccus sp.]|nr:hypothetical protein [Defluviicoccus sp.]
MGVSVIGSYPDYIKVSDKLGARRFDIGDAWHALPDDSARWEANRFFLDKMLEAGDTFVWSTDPRSLRPGPWLFREAYYLLSKGEAFPIKRVWVP